jgi:hypothetical protein
LTVEPLAIKLLASRTELVQVMIEVFVHSGSPLLRRDGSEERMRMFRAARFPALVKLANATLQLQLFAGKVSFIGDHKLLVRGTVPGKCFVVRKDGPNERAKHPANEQPGQNEAPGSHIERRGTMRHHLRDIHFPPPVLGRGLQLVDAQNHFRDRCGLK